MSSSVPSGMPIEERFESSSIIRISLSISASDEPAGYLPTGTGEAKRSMKRSQKARPWRLNWTGQKSFAPSPTP